MSRKAFSGLYLTLLLVSAYFTMFGVQPANSVAVRSDPSVTGVVLIWTVSPLDFGTLYVMPGETVNLTVTISNDKSSNVDWTHSYLEFGPLNASRGDITYTGHPPPIAPGSSWEGTLLTIMVLDSAPWGANVTDPGCTLGIVCSDPSAQPLYYYIPVHIIAGPPPQSIMIYTDQYTYHMGDKMYLGLSVENRLADPFVACIAIWLERPSGPYRLLLHAHAVTLPGGFSYNNPSFRTYVLPFVPLGVYTWHAALLDPSPHAVLIEDTAEWLFS